TKGIRGTACTQAGPQICRLRCRAGPTPGAPDGRTVPGAGLGLEEVYLPAARRQGAQAAPDAEEQELGDVAEVKAHAPARRPPVFARLEPDEVGLVREPPRLEYRQPLGDQRVGDPEVQVALRRGQPADWQGHDRGDGHGGVAAQTVVFGGHLAGAVAELPRGV